MNCRIDAWLEDGKPCIRITDADSGRVCLKWSSGGCAGPDDADRCAGDLHHCPADAALHGLVRDLFLLACMDRVSRKPPQQILLNSGYKLKKI